MRETKAGAVRPQSTTAREKRRSSGSRVLANLTCGVKERENRNKLVNVTMRKTPEKEILCHDRDQQLRERILNRKFFCMYECQ